MVNRLCVSNAVKTVLQVLKYPRLLKLLTHTTFSEWINKIHIRKPQIRKFFFFLNKLMSLEYKQFSEL